MKEGAKEPEVMADVYLLRKKCTHIIKNILDKQKTEKLVDILRNCTFSVLVDESTDITVNKNLCVSSRNLHTAFKHVFNLIILVFHIP